LSDDPDDPDSADAVNTGAVVDRANGFERHEMPASPEPPPSKEELPAPAATTALPAAAEASPPTAGGAKQPAPKQKKRRWRVVKRWLSVSAVGAAAAAALICVHSELRIKGPFDVLPVRNADVRAVVEGLVSEVVVEEGQAVQEGDPIAHLFDRDVLAELKKTEAAIEETQAKLRLLVAGPRAEEIDQARIEVAKDAEAITFATSRLDREKTLFEEKLVPNRSWRTARQISPSEK